MERIKNHITFHFKSALEDKVPKLLGVKCPLCKAKMLPRNYLNHMTNKHDMHEGIWPDILKKELENVIDRRRGDSKSVEDEQGLEELDSANEETPIIKEEVEMDHLFDSVEVKIEVEDEEEFSESPLNGWDLIHLEKITLLKFQNINVFEMKNKNILLEKPLYCLSPISRQKTATLKKPRSFFKKTPGANLKKRPGAIKHSS